MTHGKSNSNFISRISNAIVIISLLFVGCRLSTAGLATVVGNGDMKTENREVSDFHKVKIGGALEAKVIYGEVPSVEITADENILPMVNTCVTSSGALSVKTAGGRNYDLKSPIQVTITTPVCDAIEVAGASVAVVNGFDQKELRSKCLGDSELIVESKVGHIDLSASGASKVHVDTYAVKTAELFVSGASQVAITANETIEGAATDASVITYSGNPKNVAIETSGVSRVRRDEEHASL